MIQNGPMRKRILKETDYALLKQKLCNEPGFICLNEADLETLRNGEAAFFLESPLAATVEEAATMAKIAAEKMAPAPGNVILARLLQVIGDSDLDLDAVDQIAGQIVESLSVNSGCFLGARFCDGQKGIGFVFATAEGRADTMEEAL